MKQLKIIVVEDNKDFVEAIYKTVEFYAEKIEFIYVTSGEDAVEKLKANEIDLVFLDLELDVGKMSGEELLQFIKKEYTTLNIVIVTGTRTEGFSTKKKKELYKGKEVRTILGKPVAIKEIEEIINNVRRELGKA